MKVLELTDAKGWSGGVEQIYQLSKSLQSKNIDFVLGTNTKGRLFEKLKLDNNIPHVSFDMQKEVYVPTIWKVAQFVKKNKIDIIHAHHPNAHAAGLIACMWWVPDTIFITTRRVIFPLRKNPLSKLKYRSKRICKIVAVSEAVKNVLIESNIKSDLIDVIYSGVNLDKFNPDIDGSKIREEFNIKPDEILIGKIANYSHYKGHDIFLKAAKIVNKKFPNTKFLVVGEKTLNNKTLTKLTNDLEITNVVSFAGYRQDIPEIISAFDISVNSSRFEGLAGVIRESSAMAKPVVATKVGGNPEIVKDGTTGFLAEPDNPESLANSICKIIDNYDNFKKFGNAGRDFVKNNFTHEIATNKTLTLYNKLLSLRDL